MDGDAVVAAKTHVHAGVAAMRFYRVLITPWVATPRSARWMFVFVLTLLAVINMLGHTYGSPRHAWVFSAIMLGIGNAACWLLLMPNVLFLVLAAQRLRLAGINRDVTWSLLLYAALGIGVPMLYQFPHGHVLNFAIVQVLVAAGAMLYMALPAYIGFAGAFLPLLFGSVRHTFSLPEPWDPRFVLWGGTVAILLAVLFAWRWAQLLRGDYAERGLRAPNLINLRRHLSGLRNDPLTDADLMRGRPRWLMTRAELRGVGPRQPILSLRIALGGLYLPQTITGRFRRLVPSVLIVAMMGLIFFGVTFNDSGFSSSLHYAFSRDGFRVASWMFAVFALGIVLMPVELLILRWGRANAELPLLALMPGLAPAGQAKRLLLRTAIQRPAMLLVGLLLVGWFGAISLHAGWPVALAMLAAATGCLGYLAAMALCIFGGRPPTTFGKNLLLIGLFVLLSLTLLSAQWSSDWSPLSVTTTQNVLGVAWLLQVALLLWLARRGWHGLRQRVHPFLSN